MPPSTVTSMATSVLPTFLPVSRSVIPMTAKARMASTRSPINVTR